MMLRQRLSFVMILIALSSWSCKSPTEPSPTYRLEVHGVSPGNATFATADGQPSILEFHVLLDSQDIFGTQTFTTPVASLRVFGSTFGVQRGHHTLALQVSAQTISPTVYQSNGIHVTLLEGGFSPRVVATVTLPDQTKSLLTGESIVIAFDI
jgi:hypothetical protein